jgi:hypothetical protein
MLGGMMGIALTVVAVQQQYPPGPGPGPGDPTTVYASGFGGGPMGMAAAPTGDLYVTDYQHNLIARVTPDHAVTPFAAIDGPEQVAFDGFGDLLVTAGDKVWRLPLEGERSVFASVVGATAIAVGPDGDVWVGGDTEIVRFNPFGVRKSALALPLLPDQSGNRIPRPPTQCAKTVSLAFSPAGQLHFTAHDCDGVFRVVGNGAYLMIRGNLSFVGQSQQKLQSLAFDAHGWLWVTNSGNRNVLLYDEHYALMAWPFATSITNAPTALAFLRDTTGKMTRRLVASNVGDSLNHRRIVEMNPRGMGAVGWSTGADVVIEESVRGAGLGFPYADTLNTRNATSGLEWSLLSGQLPPGVRLTSTGVLVGTPLDTGTYAFVARAAGAGHFGFRRMHLSVTGQAAPWWPSQPSVSEAIRALLDHSGAGLTSAMQQHFDERGNRNGVPDVGDLRADLRAIGQLR